MIFQSHREQKDLQRPIKCFECCTAQSITAQLHWKLHVLDTELNVKVWKDHKAHLLLLFGVGDLTFLSLLLLINKVRTEQCYLQFLSSFIDVLCKIKYWSLFELKKKNLWKYVFWSGKKKNTWKFDEEKYSKFGNILNVYKSMISSF